MSGLTLVIGNRNYSSWSLRPWLALRHTGAPFEEIVIPLGTPETRERILRHSPSGRVPLLRHGALAVWDSLAICEYLAELFPEAGLWPDDPAARAVARSAAAEMHSGFAPLRMALPMNVRAHRPDLPLREEVRADIDRIAALWRDCRARFGQSGPFLFGRFGIADAIYAPVVSRFRTYGVDPGPEARAYMDAVWDLPAMRDWVAAARAEPWANPDYERSRP